MIESPRRLLVLAGALFLVAIGGMAVACGDDDPATPGDGDAGDASPSTPPSEAGPQSDGGAGDDASDGASIDGTGSVGCGTAGDCNRNIGLYCCVTAGAYQCAPDRRDACNSGGDRLCDERADCQGAAYCCAELDASVVRTDCFYGTRCAGAGPKWEVCRPNAPDQCEPGKTCKAVNCPGQGTLYLCDVPPGCQ